MDLAALGRLILIFAAVLLVAGLVIIVLAKLTGGHGLPGDLTYRRDGVTIYFPIVTSILISIILSLILTLIFWLIGRGW